jgi:hypothetical protein
LHSERRLRRFWERAVLGHHQRIMWRQGLPSRVRMPASKLRVLWFLHPGHSVHGLSVLSRRCGWQSGRISERPPCRMRIPALISPAGPLAQPPGSRRVRRGIAATTGEHRRLFALVRAALGQRAAAFRKLSGKADVRADCRQPAVGEDPEELTPDAPAPYTREEGPRQFSRPRIR